MNYVLRDESNGKISVGTFVVENLDELIKYRDSLLRFRYDNVTNCEEFYKLAESCYDKEKCTFSFHGDVERKYSVDSQSFVDYKEYGTIYFNTILLLTCLINELDSGENFNQIKSNEVYKRFFDLAHFDESLIFEEVWNIYGANLLSFGNKRGFCPDYLAFSSALNNGLISYSFDSMSYYDAKRYISHNDCDFLNNLAGSTRLLRKC